MNLADASSLATRTYLTRVRALLPFYFVLMGVPAIVSTVGAVAVVVIGYLLSRAGVLSELYDILEEDAPIKLDSQADRASPFQQEPTTPYDADAIGQVLRDVPAATRLVLVVCLATAVLITLLAFSIVAAGRLHSVYAALTDSSPVRRGTEGVFASGRTMTALYVFEALFHLLIPVFLGSTLLALDVGPFPVSLLLVLLAIPGLPSFHAFCAFARTIAVVEEYGTFAALKRASAFFRHQLSLFVGYVFVGSIAIVGFFVVLLLLSVIQAPRLFGLVLALVFFPFFDLFRTLLYAQARPDTTVVHEQIHPTAEDEGSNSESAPDIVTGSSDETSESSPGWEQSRPASSERVSAAPPASPGVDSGEKNEPTTATSDGESIVVPPRPAADKRTRLRSAVRMGWEELVTFTTGHLGLVSLSFGVFAGAVALGWLLTAPIDGLFQASIERRIGDIFPPSTMVNFFGNNWMVGIRQATAGFLFGLPTLVSLVQNGVLIGALFRFEVAPVVLLAFLIPHGLVELPALWLSGALGLHLGTVSIGVLTGRFDRATLADEIDAATDVLVGLGLLFAVAAVIEAFVSPYYWQLFL